MLQVQHKAQHMRDTLEEQPTTSADAAVEDAASPLGAGGSRRGTVDSSTALVPAVPEGDRKHEQLRPLVLSAVLQNTDNKIWVQTPDDAVAEISGEIASLSPYIQRELIRQARGSNLEEPILLPKPVEKDVLDLIVEYAKYHAATGRSDKERKLFDERFVRLNTRTLCELTSAADSLDMKPLVELTSRALARLIEGKTPEEIRETFNLPDDLTEEEKLEPVKGVAAAEDPRIRLLNKWYAKKRKELFERKAKAIEAGPGSGACEDTRSVEELLSFIENGGDGGGSAAAAAGSSTADMGSAKDADGKSRSKPKRKKKKKGSGGPADNEAAQLRLPATSSGSGSSTSAVQPADQYDAPSTSPAAAAAGAGQAAGFTVVQQQQQQSSIGANGPCSTAPPLPPPCSPHAASSSPASAAAAEQPPYTAAAMPTAAAAREPEQALVATPPAPEFDPMLLLVHGQVSPPPPPPPACPGLASHMDVDMDPLSYVDPLSILAGGGPLSLLAVGAGPGCPPGPGQRITKLTSLSEFRVRSHAPAGGPNENVQGPCPREADGGWRDNDEDEDDDISEGSDFELTDDEDGHGDDAVGTSAIAAHWRQQQQQQQPVASTRDCDGSNEDSDDAMQVLVQEQGQQRRGTRHAAGVSGTSTSLSTGPTAAAGGLTAAGPAGEGTAGEGTQDCAGGRGVADAPAGPTPGLPCAPLNAADAAAVTAALTQFVEQLGLAHQIKVVHLPRQGDPAPPQRLCSVRRGLADGSGIFMTRD